MNATPEDTTTADLIRSHAAKLRSLGCRKGGHLALVSMAALEHLALMAKSDSIRLAAAQGILALPPVKARLATMAVARNQKQKTGAQPLGEHDVLPELKERLMAVLQNGDLLPT